MFQWLRRFFSKPASARQFEYRRDAWFFFYGYGPIEVVYGGDDKRRTLVAGHLQPYFIASFMNYELCSIRDVRDLYFKVDAYSSMDPHLALKPVLEGVKALYAGPVSIDDPIILAFARTIKAALFFSHSWRRGPSIPLEVYEHLKSDDLGALVADASPYL